MHEGSIRPADPARAQPLPQWFDDAKLGVFVHWGPYSVPGWAEPALDFQRIFATRGPRYYFRHNPYAEWYVNTTRIPGSPAWHHHRERWGTDFPYTAFGERFATAATRLDPEDWAGLFVRAGARYVVLTSKHMDGCTLAERPRESSAAPLGRARTWWVPSPAPRARGVCAWVSTTAAASM